MKAFLTVIGKDKVGIVAAISDELFKLNVNIVDITQTIMGFFHNGSYGRFRKKP